MSLNGKRIGFGLTGSHCTYDAVYPEIEKLVQAGVEVLPVVTYTVKNTETRFGRGEDWIDRIEKLTGHKAISTIVDAEPLGPKVPLDCMVISPITGSSISKFANAMTDSPVLMAAKATLRNQKPVVSRDFNERRFRLKWHQYHEIDGNEEYLFHSFWSG